VLGNESHGVSKEICDIADDFVKIEMSDNIDSLNVAVAAGILMNHL
jgi:TrmH family RNA methyltransferase